MSAAPYTEIIAAERRSLVSKAAGWISPVVIRGGRVVGVWDPAGPTAEITLFPEAGAVPLKALQAEADRIGALLGRQLKVAVGLAQ